MARIIQQIPEELHMVVVTRMAKVSTFQYTERFGPFVRKGDARAAATRAIQEEPSHYNYRVEYMTTKCDWQKEAPGSTD